MLQQNPYDALDEIVMDHLKNIFADIPEKLPDELVEHILLKGAIRIERIVSRGHCSPKDFWYDQDDNEWVVLIKGSAGLRFADHDNLIVMNSGDYIHIGKHQKHRVEWTDADQDTIWLALHYK